MSPELRNKNVYRLYMNEVNLTRLERIEQIAQEQKGTTNQVALAYLLAQDFPVVPVIGCKNKQHLLDSLGAADIKLDAATAFSIME